MRAVRIACLMTSVSASILDCLAIASSTNCLPTNSPLYPCVDICDEVLFSCGTYVKLLSSFLAPKLCMQLGVLYMYTHVSVVGNEFAV